MRVLLLSRYGRLGSRSRVRALQFLPHLRERGIEVDVSPLLPDAYLSRYYAGEGKSRVRAAGGYLRRALRLLGAGRYELLWLEDELFPYLPAWGERLLARTGPPYVVDYDDAVYLRYHPEGPVGDGSWKGAGRWPSYKLERVVRGAAAAVVGNQRLARWAEETRGSADGVHVIPSVVELDRYPDPEAGPALRSGEAPGSGETSGSVEVPRAGEAFGSGEAPGAGEGSRGSGARDEAPFTIGWIGAPVTAPYLDRIAPALERVAETGPARLVAVGAGGGLPDRVRETLPVESREWSEGSEAREIARFDVGVMPMPDAPWTRSKCAYKLVQYMAAGVPTVASPVGANREVTVPGETGFLADGTEAWVEALERLRSDPELRARMGRAGRRRVAERYSVTAVRDRLARILRAAAGRGEGAGTPDGSGAREAGASR